MRLIRQHIAFMSPPEMSTDEKRAALLSERAEVAAGDLQRPVPVGSAKGERHVPAGERLAQIDAGLANLARRA